jgi:hypothetical protein
MKPLQMQEAIVAHLKAAPAPVASRDLAARFLRLQAGDEETCRRLLAPILEPVRGVAHRPGEGWLFDPRAARGPEAERGAGPERPGPGQPGQESRGADDRPPDPIPAGMEDEAAGSLLDVVALAVDGVGPGGSGAPRALTYLPVVGGEELQEENLPAWGLDTDGVPVEEAEEGPDGAPARGIGRAAAGLGAADLEALAEAVGDLPVVAHRAAREVDPLRRAAESAGVAFHPRVISAARLGHLLAGLKANHAAADLAAALGVEAPGPDDCRGRARLVARSYLRMLPLLEKKGIRTLEGLLEFQDLPAPPIDLSGYGFTAEDLKALPAGPGVYRFLDRDGAVIYIGKAKNLKARVASYFVPGARGTAKGRAILEATHRMIIETVSSDLEAILLEAALLSERRPRLNRQFEIHERPAPYGPRLNLVIVLRDASSPTCTLHLLRGGRYLRRVPDIATGPGRPGPAALRETLGAAFFAGSPADGTGTDVDWQLVGSFLRRHRDEVNVLDIDECPSSEAAADRLAVLVAAALSGPGRTHAR